MDTSRKARNPNPRENANPLSVLFFAYVIPLFKKGYSTDLSEKDLNDPLPEDYSAVLGDRLEKKWMIQTQKKQPSFLKAVVSAFWSDLLKTTIMLAILELIVRLLPPLLLGQLLLYFKKDSTMEQKTALIYAGCMIAVSCVSAFLINHYMIVALHCGMKIRVACCSVIYRKSLRLSKTALGETATGKVVNLLSNDVSRFDILLPILNYLWTSPISALIILYFIWTKAQWAGVIGMGVVFFVVPIQAYTGKLSSRFRLQTAYKTDERVRLMEEIISGVQVIKMYAWEYPFAKLIKFARREELNIIKKNAYVRGLYMMFVLFTTRCALFSAMVAMALMDKPITADQIFVFQSFFAILSHTMSGMFVRGISELAESLVAMKRLQIYMMYEEFHEDNSPLYPGLENGEKPPLIEEKPIKDTNVAVKLTNLSAKWNPASTTDQLHNINLKIDKGKLVGIIGPVGSGKSTLLQTLLGELETTSGTTEINGTISYASQEPWVFAASVRQNILFGQTYDKALYSKVVEVCSLKRDFEQFPHGDMTMVGDRGASLSGGQKARINLARAVYRKADIYLLDDPLSAVDTHVGKHLFDVCINDYLASKTVILVTHQLQYMKDTDHLVILRDGRIEAQGTFNEVIHTDLDYAQMLTAEPEISEEELQIEMEKAKEAARKLVRQKTASVNSASSAGENEDATLKAQLAEQSSKGTVKGNLFLKYFTSGGNICAVIGVFILFLMAQTIASSCDFFVSFWINDEERRNGTTPELLPQQTEIYIFTGLIVGLFIIALTRSFAFYLLCIRCSSKLHNSMFINIIKTKMRFFDINPAGRILNRFSKDMGAIDELLPKAALDAGQVILIMVGSISLTAYVNPFFLVPVVIIGVLFQYIKKVYLKTSKNVKRMEGITRSPVFTHLNATLQGLTTIRAYKAQDILKEEFDKHQDLNTGAWYMFINASSAFGFSLDLLCFIFIATIILIFVLIKSDNNAGNVGLAITQSLALTGLVQWGMRQTAEVQNQLMSAERILEYTNLEPEPNFESDKPPPKSWPSEGRIEFISTSMKYVEEDPFVLKNLNIVINPSEKIGIVGRTGAGKSSLIAALFRLAIIEGKILIDGVDTKEIDLQNLRKRISIIPQDPVLFSGTMRRNLDPFEEYSDSVLWNALADVELKDIESSGNALECKVMDHGSNFSVGQRQLVCLARAIIRNNKILMLDEATANVDPQTDALIQNTIREKFANCTVLTVAHRLNTIMDSDKVLVMDAGQMVEYDHPHLLCQNKNGHFYKMVQETGPAMTEQLLKIAQDSFNGKKLAVTYL